MINFSQLKTFNFLNYLHKEGSNSKTQKYISATA